MTLRRFVQVVGTATSNLRLADGSDVTDTSAALSGGNALFLSNNAAIAAAASNTFNAAGTTFTRASSGVVQIRVSWTLTTSAAATVTANLVKDGSNMLAAPAGNPIQAQFSVAAAATEAFGFSWGETLTDDNPHTYSLTATAGAGTITTPTGGAQLCVAESF